MPASAAAPSGLSFMRTVASYEAAAVALEHLEIGQQVMAEGDRLGDLQVRKAGHDGFGVGLGLGEQGLLQQR